MKIAVNVMRARENPDFGERDDKTTHVRIDMGFKTDTHLHGKSAYEQMQF